MRFRASVCWKANRNLKLRVLRSYASPLRYISIPLPPHVRLRVNVRRSKASNMHFNASEVHCLLLEVCKFWEETVRMLTGSTRVPVAVRISRPKLIFPDEPPTRDHASVKPASRPCPGAAGSDLDLPPIHHPLPLPKFQFFFFFSLPSFEVCLGYTSNSLFPYWGFS